jgi:hypothetical protein
MSNPARRLIAPAVLTVLLGALGACSGSSGGDDGFATVSLAVTDAPTEELAAFVIGIASVELERADGSSVSLLGEPVAVDFAALGERSRVLHVTRVAPGPFTGVTVELLFDDDRIHLAGSGTAAALVDPDGALLTGSLAVPIAFAEPLSLAAGSVVLELDLDLDRSVAVDSVLNQVRFEPALLARVDRDDPKPLALGEELRSVDLDAGTFRVAFEAPSGQPMPLLDVATDAATVFQIDGVCSTGAAGLAALSTRPQGSWVQAFGAFADGAPLFRALAVEAGSGSYNGGTDIVEGVIVGRSGGAGADAVLTVRGFSSDATHTRFQFDVDFTVSTTLAGTKVVRRGSAAAFDADELTIGQHVRCFGLLDEGTDALDATTAADVVRVEPVRLAGLAAGGPAGGELVIDLERVGPHEAGTLDWPEGGLTPTDPDAVALDVGNLGAGQGIGAGTPVLVTGWFLPIDDASGTDFVASSLVNLERAPALLLVRDRTDGLTVAPTVSAAGIALAFGGAATGFETAVVDRGFAGATDVTASGMTVVPDHGLGLGLYALRDRTLNTLQLHFTFASFAAGLEEAFASSATLFDLGALGEHQAGTGELRTRLAGAVVR